MPKAKRRIKLIQPRLQLKLVFTFLGLSALGLAFECILFAACLAEMAADLPQDGILLLERTPAILWRVSLLSLAGILPLVFTVGVLVTFRVAGPLYRLERFLKEILRGDKPADCTLRDGDELKGFCELLNQATAPLRLGADDRGRSTDAATAADPASAKRLEADPARELGARPMSLRSKILLILGAAIVLFAGVDHVIQQMVVFEQFVKLEREEAKKDLDRVVQALQGEIRHLDRRCEDWATWDDTFSYVAEPNPAYVSSNLGDEGLRKNGINLLYICDTTGRVAWGRILDLVSGRPISMREFPSGAISTSHPLIVGEPRRSGLWMTERGPMLVSSKPILDSRRQEQPRGTVIMGRLLTADLEMDLAGRTGVAFDALALESEALSDADQAGLDEVTAAAGPVVRVVDDERLHAWTTFPDMREAPALLIRAEIPRAITGQGAASVRYALISTVAAGFLIMLVLLNLLQRTVLRPIAALTSFAVEIGRSDETSRKLNLVRGDEIGVLSREFDAMLEKLSRSRAALVVTAREAGMSEIATAVLHNVGNVLNSVNVSARLVAEKTRASGAQDLASAMRAVEDSAGDLATFLEKDPRGPHLQPLLRSLAEQMATEQEAILGEVKTLTEGIDHIRELVQAQQGFAGRSGVLEKAALSTTIESAIAMTGGEDGLEVVRDFEELAPGPIDRHHVTEILVNLLKNARDAVREGAPAHPRICLRLRRPEPGRVRIEVEDNGVGIPAENIALVFTHGFTTKKGGHGFGLHSSANAAVEMKGTLSARSEGPGRGATFVLELPVQEVSAEAAIGASA